VHHQNQKKNAKKPIVSVVVPVWNGAATIRPLLDSLLKIHYPKPKIEIIVVDGASTDKTRQIVEEYPVRLLIEKKKGPNAARNTGITHATGELIAFTDSDCVVSKTWIKKAVDNFSDSSVGCVGGGIKSLNDNFLSRYASISVAPVIRLCKTRKELDHVGPLVGCPVGCNMIFSRIALNDAGKFDESVQYSFEEDELIERVCNAGYKVVLDPQVTVQHKHRSRLKNLLEQSFKYGKGTGRMLKKPSKTRFFRRWLIADFSIFAQMIIVAVLGTFPMLIGNWSNFFLFISTMFSLPLLALTTIYSLRIMLNKLKLETMLYPGIDFLRGLAFMAGEFYGLVARDRVFLS
jgi:cellulose synthase/poly-beta-1,6-N-acetylglucosamine synthase-like glycosyltransferase